MKQFLNRIKVLTTLYLVGVLIISFKFIFPVVFDYGESGGWVDLSGVVLAIGIALVIIVTLLYIGIAWLIWGYHKSWITFKKIFIVELTLLFIMIVCLIGYEDMWKSFL